MTLLNWLAQYAHIMGLLLPVFVCAAIGVAWALKKKTYPNEFVSTLVTSVTIPALVFHTILTTELDDTLLLQVVSVTVLALVIMATFAAVMLTIMRLPVLSLLPTATFPNAGNLGLPVAQLAFGETGLAVAVTVFTLLSFTQHTLGVWILGWSGRSKGSQKRKWPIGVAVACFAAVSLRMLEQSLPAPMLSSAQLVGSLTVPLMLISLGYALATVSRSSIGAGTIVGAIRLASGVVAAIVLTSLFDLPPAVTGAVVLQLLMPVAVVSYLYSERYTTVGATSAGAVLVSTALFFVASPLVIGWASSMAG